MKIWARQIKDSRLVKDIVSEQNDPEMTRTHKIFKALEEICKAWDIAVPIWLDVNIREFKERSLTAFTADNFTEQIMFDRLEFKVLEE